MNHCDEGDKLQLMGTSKLQVVLVNVLILFKPGSNYLCEKAQE